MAEALRRMTVACIQIPAPKNLKYLPLLIFAFKIPYLGSTSVTEQIAQGFSLFLSFSLSV